ncbi:hypothetical protein PISMIDRAFT_684182 [Pisolithus microcarpus 441]|uniref:Uncharacterized protein n=1 Tax=Pisolithus microcarpus 441 TaxID=765257 RepID=A0A0C9Y148_9AGAM|nr:hypothetical protein PISMIDRAFT_684182 [Pisolithus microcarpus 441]
MRDISGSNDADATKRAPSGRSRRALLYLKFARGAARRFSRKCVCSWEGGETVARWWTTAGPNATKLGDVVEGVWGRWVIEETRG